MAQNLIQLISARGAILSALLLLITCGILFRGSPEKNNSTIAKDFVEKSELETLRTQLNEVRKALMDISSEVRLGRSQDIDTLSSLQLEKMRKTIQIIRSQLGSVVCKDRDHVTSTGGWCLQERTGDGAPIEELPNGIKIPQHHVKADPLLVDAFGEFFEGASLLDLGAGVGQYEAVWKHQNRHIDTTAFDGALNVEEYTKNTVIWADLTVPLYLGKRYDWVLSLEVGEHIPAAHEADYLANLHDHNRCGILLSWAIPGQGGHSHVNEKSNEDVITQFSHLGYVYDQTRSLQFRNRCTYDWFKQTIMLFHRPEGNCKEFTSMKQ